MREVNGVDVLAREACYHNTCRREYIRCVGPQKPDTQSTEDAKRLEAHRQAFAHICEYVKKQIIQGLRVERMTMLHERYFSLLQMHSPEYYTADYKTNKLKEKLYKRFGDKIKFWHPNYRSDLVYSEEIPTGQTIEVAFETASSDEQLEMDIAQLLRRLIIDSKSDISYQTWSPTAQNLQSDSVKLPELLLDFLSHLISGKGTKTGFRSEKTEHSVKSFAQDMCYAVTNGTWQLSKHLLLGMTIRHLTLLLS